MEGFKPIEVTGFNAWMSLKNLLMRLFLRGCFAGDFQEGKRPIKAFWESAHWGRKMAH